MKTTEYVVMVKLRAIYFNSHYVKIKELSFYFYIIIQKITLNQVINYYC